MRATDGGTPQRTDSTVVEVRVDRNVNKPVFDPQTYTARVLETLPLGSVVATVTARDADLRVI